MPRLHGQWLLGVVSTVTALGFMQIGYDNGLMGGLINNPAWNKTFDSPDPTITGLIVSILEVGAFVGSIASAIFGEKIGRKKSVLVGITIMIIGSILQATAFCRAHIIVARIVAGVGLGITNSTVPVLLAEFAPKATRGIFVCAQLSTLNCGIFLVYWIDYAFANHTGSYAWRVPTILQCVFLFTMLGLCFLIDETPRWLIAHDHTEEARDVIHRLRGSSSTHEEIDALYNDIVRTIQVENAANKGSWTDIFREDNLKSRRRLLIACAIQAFQQLGGINAIIYYSGTLFAKSIGFSAHMSALMSGFLQTWFFVASFIPWVLIDSIGRRPLLLSMIAVMAAVMAVQAALIYQVQNKTSVAHSCGIAAAVMLFVYEGAFTIGFQATVWVYPSEILPLRFRQKGSSISTASNWIMNFMITQITPPALHNIGWRYYIVFAVLNATWLPIIYLFFPETKGLELEDVDRLFEKSGGQMDAMRHMSIDMSHEKAKDHSHWDEEGQSKHVEDHNKDIEDNFESSS